jgi:hypothetical protein
MTKEHRCQNTTCTERQCRTRVGKCECCQTWIKKCKPPLDLLPYTTPNSPWTVFICRNCHHRATNSPQQFNIQHRSLKFVGETVDSDDDNSNNDTEEDD